MEYNTKNKPVAELYSALSDLISKADIYAANMLSNVAFSIREKRVEMEMTQKELAELMGVTQGMVSKWEKGDYNFTLETIAEICEKLRMTVDLIIEDEDSSVRKTYKANAGFVYEITSTWRNDSASDLLLSSGALGAAS